MMNCFSYFTYLPKPFNQCLYKHFSAGSLKEHAPVSQYFSSFGLTNFLYNLNWIISPLVFNPLYCLNSCEGHNFLWWIICFYFLCFIGLYHKSNFQADVMNLCWLISLLKFFLFLLFLTLSCCTLLCQLSKINKWII